MNTRKVFVGVSLSDAARKLILRKLRDFDELPIRWGADGSWRLVLAFAGHWNDVDLPEFLMKLENTVQEVEAFDLIFDRILLGPDQQRAKMVWLSTSEPQSQYADLRTVVDRVLAPLTPAHAPMTPHVTLGRIKQKAWHELTETPTIDKQASIVVAVEAITVWESTTIDGSNTYIPLAEFPLSFD